jgi:hypothetical protein
VAEPAAAAVRRRGEPAALGREPGLGQRLVLRRQRRVDARRDVRVLDRAAAVALDEGDHDVLAAQIGEQLAARGAAEGVLLRLLGELRLVLESRAHPVHTVLDEGGRAPGRDRRTGAELQTERRAGDPGGPGHQGGPAGRVAVTDHDVAHPEHRQSQHDEHDEDERHDPDQGADRTPAAHRVLDVRLCVVEEDPVEDHVESSAEEHVEADVEEVQDGQQAEAQAGDDRHHQPWPARQDDQHGGAEDGLHRDAYEQAGPELVERGRHEKREAHER